MKSKGRQEERKEGKTEERKEGGRKGRNEERTEKGEEGSHVLSRLSCMQLSSRSLIDIHTPFCSSISIKNILVFQSLSALPTLTHTIKHPTKSSASNKMQKVRIVLHKCKCFQKLDHYSGPAFMI